MRPLLKTARLSTPQEKMRAKMNYQKNKLKRKRKSKRRKRLQDSGIKRKKKRMGTAAGGYSFMADPTQGAGGSGGGGGGGGPSAVQGGSTKFDPNKQPRSTQRLSKMVKQL